MQVSYIGMVLLLAVGVGMLVAPAAAAVTPYEVDAYTVALLHMDGSDGSTTFVDETGRSWSSATPGQLTTSLKMIGTASGRFDAVNDYVLTADSSDFAFGENDFTLDFWMRRNSAGAKAYEFVFAQGPTPALTVTTPIQAYIATATGRLSVTFGDGSTYKSLTSVTSFPASSTWHHIAIVRHGTTATLYIDGVSEATADLAGFTLYDSPAGFGIGRPGDHADYYFGGYVDEFRVSKGVARWTANFVLDTSQEDPLPGDEHTADTWTKALLHFNGADGSTGFTDDTGRTWLRYGDPEIDTYTWVYGGASGLFDGVDDYILTADSSDFALGSGDFTIDFWTRRNSPTSKSYEFICAQGPTPASTAVTPFQIYVLASTGQIVANFGNGGAYRTITSSATLPAYSDWTHIAVVRAGNMGRLYVNGALSGSCDLTGFSLYDSPAGLALGRPGDHADYYYGGWIDEFQISKGIARWTTDFTPGEIPDNSLDYYAYGDSITMGYGYADLASDGSDVYILQMRDIYDSTARADHNTDGGGMTSGWGLENIGSHMNGGNPITTYVYMFGLNDEAQSVTAAACAANLIAIYEYADARCERIIPIIPTLMTQSGPTYRVLTTQRAYLQELEGYLDAEGIRYVRGYDAVDSVPGNGVPDSPATGYYATDGVHLNVAGHAALAAAIWDVASAAPPTAAFSASPTTGTASLTVQFTDTSTGDPTAWSWSFGDGGTSTAQNPAHTYTSAGTYTVTLTATNAEGSDTETKAGYITVSPPPVSAAFVASPTTGTAPLTVQFTDTSTGSPNSWSWNFGDGSTGLATDPRYTYTVAGTYTVTLTVSNSGGSDSETKTNYITVAAAPPTTPPTPAPTARPGGPGGIKTSQQQKETFDFLMMCWGALPVAGVLCCVLFLLMNGAQGRSGGI